MALESKRNRPKFEDNVKTFSFEKRSSDGVTEFWKCDARGTCNARIHIRNGMVVNRVNGHTHAGNSAKVKALRALTAMKHRARDTQEPTAQILAQGVLLLNRPTLAALPQMSSVKRMTQRVRDQGAPANPQNLADLVIPPNFQQFETEPGVMENSLLYDSGPQAGNNRFLIFSTARNLQMLKESNEWFMDGTFDTAPPLFAQIYSIHGTHLGQTHPLVFALLPNKRQDMYESLLREVINLTPGQDAPVPASILTDFEISVINASTAVFPNTEHSGCFFHLTQRFPTCGSRPQLGSPDNLPGVA